MEALHARYPFLEAASQSVEADGTDLATIAGQDGPVVERAMDRVRGAIENGTVGPQHRSDRVELLSYPVGRVLVSLVDEPGLLYRYARAEADTARERFVADIEGGDELRSVGRQRISLETLLEEFDLESAVYLERAPIAEETGGTGVQAGSGASVGVDVGVYLQHTEDLSDSTWTLKRRSLSDGLVSITREELHELLREAIRERVAADLPLSVPDEIASGLADRIESVRSLLADYDHEWDVGRIDPEAFPPCIGALIERATAGEQLASHSQFSLVSFLITTGMETEEIAQHFADPDEISVDRLTDRIDRLRDGDSTPAYPMPSCQTMVAYGDCVNKDALCERIPHPLEYYERRLAGDQAE